MIYLVVMYLFCQQMSDWNRNKAFQVFNHYKYPLMQITKSLRYIGRHQTRKVMPGIDDVIRSALLFTSQ